VPDISRFFGIVIFMYYNDHEPPHVHARYGDAEIRVDLRSCEVLSGQIPTRAQQRVVDWIELNRSSLLDSWMLAGARKPLPRIEPLK